MKSLPTRYAGAVFRSRLEARWASFFDAMAIRWEYEPEGFRLDDGSCYLPDFWLPDWRMWAEVKPDDGPNERDREKAYGLVRGSGHGLLILAGAPRPQVYEWLELATHEGISKVVSWETGFTGKAIWQNRMWLTPAECELVGDEEVVEAMTKARNKRFEAPTAADYASLGWEHVPT